MSPGKNDRERGRAYRRREPRAKGRARIRDARTKHNIAERNRKNALHSTGPRTEAGKMNSRWNALRNGLCIRECLIPMGQGRENRNHLMKILSTFRADFDICGIAEELVVEQLAVVYWEMSRQHRAEVGEIRLGLDFAADRVMTQWVEEYDNPDTDIRTPFTRHWRRLQQDFQHLAQIEDMVVAGRLDRGPIAELFKAMRTAGAKAVLADLLPYLEQRELSPGLRAQILAALRRSREYLERAVESYNKNGTIEMWMRADAESARCHAPDTARAGYLMRRESALALQFSRLLRDLERLQKARGGGAATWHALGQDDPSRTLPFVPEPLPKAPAPKMAIPPVDVPVDVEERLEQKVAEIAARARAKIDASLPAPEAGGAANEIPSVKKSGDEADPQAKADEAEAWDKLSMDEQIERTLMEGVLRLRREQERRKNPPSTDTNSKPTPGK